MGHNICVAKHSHQFGEINFTTVLKFVLEKIYVDAKNNAGDSALNICAKKAGMERPDVYDKAIIMLENGAKMDVANGSGETFVSLVDRMDDTQYENQGSSLRGYFTALVDKYSAAN